MKRYCGAFVDSVCGQQGEWHEKLREMVQHIDTSFGDFFKSIGCVGEILLDDNDPVSKLWSKHR